MCVSDLSDQGFKVFLLFCPPLSFTSASSLCEVGQKDQERALAVALSDSLWLAGQEVSATVTLVTEDYCITPHLDYKLDNFTERVPDSTAWITHVENNTSSTTEPSDCFSVAAVHIQQERGRQDLRPGAHTVCE